MVKLKSIGSDFSGSSLINSVYLNVLFHLREQGINFCLLRNRPEIEEKLSDLDILVHPADFKKFEEICEKMGFIHIKSKRMNPFKYVFVAHLKNEFWTLDVHTEMISRGYIYMDRDQVLKRKRSFESYFMPSEEDLLLSLLFHILIGKKSFPKKHLLEINRLFSLKLDYSYIQSHLIKYGLWEIFKNFNAFSNKEMFNQGDFMPLKKRTLRSLRFKPISNIFRQIKMKVRKLKDFIPFFKNNGLAVAFVGPDGMGKTSVVQEVKKHYSHYVFGSSSAYLGPWGGYQLPFWKLAKKVHLSPSMNKNHPRWSLKYQIYLIRGFLYYILLAFELLYRYYKLIFPNLIKEKIVLIDRYIYDILAGHRKKEIGHFTRIRKFLCRFFPSPSLVFLLDGPPEMAIHRKKGITLKEMTELRKTYHKIAETVRNDNTHVHIVHADRTLNETSKEVAHIIWHELKEQ